MKSLSYGKRKCRQEVTSPVALKAGGEDIVAYKGNKLVVEWEFISSQYFQLTFCFYTFPNAPLICIRV